MKVEMVHPIDGEEWRFHVDSRTPGADPYLVDLEEFSFNGFCGCNDFTFTMLPELVRRIKPGPKIMCFHIKKALQWVELNKGKVKDVIN